MIVWRLPLRNTLVFFGPVRYYPRPLPFVSGRVQRIRPISETLFESVRFVILSACGALMLRLRCRTRRRIGFDGGRELIELRLRALTARGEHIVDFLRESQDDLHRNCRPHEVCMIEITEMPDQRIDAIVTVPRPVGDPGEWKPYTVVRGMYGRRFDKGTSAERIHRSLDAILRASSAENALTTANR